MSFLAPSYFETQKKNCKPFWDAKRCLEGAVNRVSNSPLFPLDTHFNNSVTELGSKYKNLINHAKAELPMVGHDPATLYLRDL